MMHFYRAQQHQVLGSGQFGTVKKGIWNSNGVRVEVALKMLKEDSETDTDKIKLLQEAVIMAQFQHANVLYLHGVARQGEAVGLLEQNFFIKAKFVVVFPWSDYNCDGACT